MGAWTWLCITLNWRSGIVSLKLCSASGASSAVRRLAGLYLDRSGLASLSPPEAEAALARSLSLWRLHLRLTPDADTHAALITNFLDKGAESAVVQLLAAALPLYPTDWRFTFLQAALARRQRHFANAVAILQAAGERFPQNPLLWTELGDLYRVEVGQLPLALAAYQKAAELEPNSSAHAYNIGSVYVMANRLELAIKHYEDALAKQQVSSESVSKRRLTAVFVELLNLRARTCDWRQYAADFAQLEEILTAADARPGPYPVPSWHAIGYPLPPARLLQIESRAAAMHLAAVQPALRPYPYPTRPHGQRLRVGIVTGDAGDTNVGRDILSMFTLLPATTRLELFLYSSSPDMDSSWRRKTVQACPNFHDIFSLSDPAAADLIHSHQIHVLINLNGYTKNSRNGVFALQPAPLQVMYKGYSGSLGADYVQYMIGDQHATPLAMASNWREKLLLLPHSFFLTSYPEVFGYVLNESLRSTYNRSTYGLPEDAFVFANFNHLYKVRPCHRQVNPPIFSVWMSILKRVPGSVLWLQELPAEAAPNLRREAAARGVNPARLIFTPLYPLRDHLNIKGLTV